MKTILTIAFAVSSVFCFAQSSETAIIHFIGAKFQKDPKLEIFINGKPSGYITKGLQIDHVQKTLGEITILTQCYDMIDAKYGAPIQMKMTVEAGKEYYLSAKYTAKNHLTLLTKEEALEVTKNGKKIISVIDQIEK
jgi:hypothetical protein